METYSINALVAALIYSLAAIFAKGALQTGCGLMRFSFLMNQIFAVVFVLALAWKAEPITWSQLHLPIISGALFFTGQVFTFGALRMGDVSLQTPIMGTKAVFVALLAIVLGLQEVSWQVCLAAVLSMLAVALLGFSGGSFHHAKLTIGLSLLSALTFAASDQMVGVFGAGFGTPSFLVIAMMTNAALSWGLIPFFSGSIRDIPRDNMLLIALASVGMAIQATILNYTLSNSGEVVAINILYSSRGFISVLIGCILSAVLRRRSEIMTARTAALRFLGAVLISVAIFIALDV